MKFVRTVSTRRLLATLVGLMAAIGAGTAIAVAASDNGSIPQPASLATAIHRGLSGPKITGLSADIQFTNHLIAASNLQGSDPLLSGASGRVWFSPGQHKLRLELQSDNGDAQIVLDGNRFWISDPRAGTLYEGTLPGSAQGGAAGRAAPQDSVPSLGQIESELTKLLAHVTLNGAAGGTPAALPGDVGGQPTYSVRISPKHDGGLLGAAQVAWDAARGVPLDLAVYASGDASPVLELKASNVSYGAIAASNFAVMPTAGEKVVKISPPAAARALGAHDKHHRTVTGLAVVAATLPFKLAAPDTIAGLPRRTVAKLDWGGKPAALVTYGQGIGGIAVIERSLGKGSGVRPVQIGRPARGSGESSLSLPTVSIAGNTAHELDTALGTVVMFSHGSVSYTVIGSVPPGAAEAAAADVAKAA